MANYGFEEASLSPSWQTASGLANQYSQVITTSGVTPIQGSKMLYFNPGNGAGQSITGIIRQQITFCSPSHTLVAAVYVAGSAGNSCKAAICLSTSNAPGSSDCTSNANQVTLSTTWQSVRSPPKTATAPATYWITIYFTGCNANNDAFADWVTLG